MVPGGGVVSNVIGTHWPVIVLGTYPGGQVVAGGAVVLGGGVVVGVTVGGGVVVGGAVVPGNSHFPVTGLRTSPVGHGTGVVVGGGGVVGGGVITISISHCLVSSL